MNRFEPTHRITFQPHKGEPEVDDVQLMDEGAAYTRQEWVASATADWACRDGQWLWQGEETPGRRPGRVEVEPLFVALTGRKRSFAQWQLTSDEDLGAYLKPGDVVDDEMADYLLNVVFPACMREGFVQCGEPNHHGLDGKARYATVQREGALGWVFTGYRHQGLRVRLTK